MADFRTLKLSGHFWDNTKRIPYLLDVRNGYSMHNTAGRGGPPPCSPCSGTTQTATWQTRPSFLASP